MFVLVCRNKLKNEEKYDVALEILFGGRLFYYCVTGLVTRQRLLDAGGWPAVK